MISNSWPQDPKTWAIDDRDDDLGYVSGDAVCCEGFEGAGVG